MQTAEIINRFNSVAHEYDEQRRFFIPCFDDFYEKSVSFLSQAVPSVKSVLDLGAGTGLLTKYLYAFYPDASFTLVDVSEQMLSMARIRFSECQNFNYQVADYSVVLPSGEYDLIASALSIHHLTEDEKLVLFQNIFNRLPEGGCFVNFDIFNASTVSLTELYNEEWYRFIRTSPLIELQGSSWMKRRELDKENSVDETVFILRKAGFKIIECLYKNQKFGVVMAVKQG